MVVVMVVVVVVVVVGGVVVVVVVVAVVVVVRVPVVTTPCTMNSVSTKLSCPTSVSVSTSHLIFL